MTAEFGLLTIDVRERNLETLDDIEETSLDFYATIGAFINKLAIVRSPANN
jgi:hypothetical protein